MDYQEFIRMVAERFNVHARIYKEKFNQLMVWWMGVGENGIPDPMLPYVGSGVIGGPDCGHSGNAKMYYFTYKGWAYVLHDDEWFSIRDGIVDWRQTPTAPFDSIPHSDDLNPSIFIHNPLFPIG